MLVIPNPNLESLLARQLQQENHPVLQSVVYRLCENPCDLGSAVSVYMVTNSCIHANIYFPFARAIVLQESLSVKSRLWDDSSRKLASY